MTNVDNLKTNQLVRYSLIETIAYWEGRINATHLMHAFDIGREQAASEIKAYREAYSGQLDYDAHVKGFKPTVAFKPQLTRGDIAEYVTLIQKVGRSEFGALVLKGSCSTFTQVVVPDRSVSPELVRILVQACENKDRIEVEYASMKNPKPEVRVIAPHTIVFNGLRWHVRAYCEKNRRFMDFVLTRFRGDAEVVTRSEYTIEEDIDWNTSVTVVIKPDVRLSAAQKKIISNDFGMKNGALRLKTRGPLVHYLLKSMQLDDKILKGRPSAQQIMIHNLDAISQWLIN